MPNLVTKTFRHHNAEQFKEAFSEAAPTFMYLFIGRNTPWSAEASPDTPTDTISNNTYEYWRSMIAAKRVQSVDTTYAIPRYNWVTNTRYREYDNLSTTLFDTPAGANTFYVLTDDYNVYKCLFNNKSANSTVKPTGTSTSSLVTADGYHWKFAYSVSAADALKFLTTNYIPVKTLTANDGSSQWTAQQAAVNGAIQIIDITAAGSSYKFNTGTVGAANSSTITLAAGANTTDDVYVGSSLYIDSGLGSGQLKEIVNYVGTTKVATINAAFSTTPNTTSTYILSPLVTIVGDGTGATAYSNVTAGALNYVNMITVGSQYSKATVTVTANVGSGATATARISPYGGHGSNPVRELGAYNVMLNVQLSGSESDTFPTVNDYRVIGLLKDPKLRSGGTTANGSVYDQTTQLTLTSVSNSGRFTLDEIITANTSMATARVVSFANTNSGNTAGILRVASTNAVFSATELVTGNTSTTNAVIASIAYGTLEDMTGDLLYMENRVAISRATDQTEDIKLVVKF